MRLRLQSHLISVDVLNLASHEVHAEDTVNLCEDNCITFNRVLNNFEMVVHRNLGEDWNIFDDDSIQELKLVSDLWVIVVRPSENEELVCLLLVRDQILA